MRSLSVLGAMAVLAVLPSTVHAQSVQATSPEVVVKESTTVVVKEAPKPSPVTFTPYGFLLLNVYFNDAAGARSYPYPSQCAGGASCEGNVLFNVRQTRLGSRLKFDDRAGWTHAVLSAVLEVDFNGGYTTTAASSSGYYSPVLRLRKAFVDATWGEQSKLVLRIGQDDRLVSPLRPVSLAYIADPLFQNAGLLHGRAPMIRLGWEMTPRDGIAVSVAAAAMNPQENTLGDNGVSPGAAIDLGAGNRSRVPNFEGRVGVGLRSGGKNVVALGGWGGWRKNRFVSPATDTNVDVNSWIVGGDLTLNVSIVQVMGEIYRAAGYDTPGSLGASQGIALSLERPTPTTFAITGAQAVPAFGGWFQVAVRPVEPIQVYGGWGGTQSPADAYPGTVLALNATRIQNFMWAAGIIGYAGKNWRFSAEYGRATSWFYNATSFSQGQFSINSQVVF